MKALILAGSDVTVTDALRELCRGAALVIAADSGVRHAAPLGVTLDLIVGDFDSATAADLARYPDVPRERHPVRKDRLDLELALAEAAARGATELLIVGALGGRLDQTLAALLIAARYRADNKTHQKPGPKVTLHSGHTAAYPLGRNATTGDVGDAGDEVLVLELPPGQVFSVLSLGPVAVVSLTGASYPLTRAELPFGVGLGVSNLVASSPLTVTLHRGSALVVLPS